MCFPHFIDLVVFIFHFPCAFAPTSIFVCALSSDVCHGNYCVQLFSNIFVFSFFSIFVFLFPSFSPFIYFSHSSILASTTVHYVHGFLLRCNF
jgi:hypothetical protein